MRKLTLRCCANSFFLTHPSGTLAVVVAVVIATKGTDPGCAEVAALIFSLMISAIVAAMLATASASRLLSEGFLFIPFNPNNNCRRGKQFFPFTNNATILLSRSGRLTKNLTHC